MAWIRSNKKQSSPGPTPSTYENYIYNIGHVAFNTGYKHKTTTKIRMKASIDPLTPNWSSIFGYEQGAWRTNAMAFATGDNGSQLAIMVKGAWTEGDIWTAAESSTSSNWGNVPSIYEFSGTTILWYRESDPNTVHSLTSQGTIADAIGPMGIWVENVSTEEDGWQKTGKSVYMRLFWFEIYESNILVHRFIPAYNNNQWCLYDEVGETYIYDLVDSGANLRGFIAS